MLVRDFFLYDFTCHFFAVSKIIPFFFQATPSLVHLLGESLLSNGERFCDTSLRILCLGAEPFLPRPIIKRLIGNINTIQLYNIYGISEVSSWSSIEQVSLIEPVQLCEASTDTFVEDSSSLIDKARLKEILGNGFPIGKPLTGTVIEVRSDSDQAISNGVGEIWVGKSFFFFLETS